jgi:hypothetical protein
MDEQPGLDRPLGEGARGAVGFSGAGVAGATAEGQPLAHLSIEATRPFKPAVTMPANVDRSLADTSGASPEKATRVSLDGSQPLAQAGRIAAGTTRPMALSDAGLLAPPVWLIRNKIDLPAPVPTDESRPNDEYKFICSLLARDGNGVEALLGALEAHVRGFFGSESGLITRERHRHALQESEAILSRALAEGQGQKREDIVAEELRLAARALGRLTGKVDVEDVLDVIFRDFCIGK